jgi:hypothetical protein
MATVTIKINEKSQAGKTFLELVKFFHSKKNAIEIIEEKSPYNPEFVKMVKSAAKSKNRTRINPKNVWESIL